MVEVKPFKVEVISENSDYDMNTVFIDSAPKFMKREGDKIYRNDEVFTEEEFLNEMIDFDLSISYFKYYNLKITSSIIIRDYFYSVQIPGRWAYSHRNGLENKHFASSEAYSPSLDDEYYELFTEKIKEYEDGEIDYDTARGYMPLSYSTTWDISISAKMLVRVLGQLFYDFGQCQMTHTIWTEFANIPSFQPWLKMIGKYCTNNIRVEYGNPTIYKRIGFTLYAQLVRHEGVYVTGVERFVKSFLDGTLPTRICSETVDVAVTVSESRWRQILKTRTAWFSMTDNWDDNNSWSIFLKDKINGNLEHDVYYLKYFDDDMQFDPSAVTSYAVDGSSLRIRSGKTPYFPDAFALESKQIVYDRINSRGINPLLRDYLQIFDMGFVKDNPDNPLRRKWESVQSTNTN